jgi:hypothetical protein
VLCNKQQNQIALNSENFHSQKQLTFNNLKACANIALLAFIRCGQMVNSSPTDLLMSGSAVFIPMRQIQEQIETLSLAYKQKNCQ